MEVLYFRCPNKDCDQTMKVTYKDDLGNGMKLVFTPQCPICKILMVETEKPAEEPDDVPHPITEVDL